MAARNNEFASTASVNRWPDVGNKVTHGVVVETNPTELAQKDSVVHGSVADSQYFSLRRLDPRRQSQLPVVDNIFSDALGLLPKSPLRAQQTIKASVEGMCATPRATTGKSRCNWAVALPSA